MSEASTGTSRPGLARVVSFGISGVVFLALVLLVSSWGDTTGWMAKHVFWVFVLLPGVVSIAYYWLSVPFRYQQRADDVEVIRAVQKAAPKGAPSRKRGSAQEFASALQSREVVAPADSTAPRLPAGPARENEPAFASTFFAAACLVLVYGTAALLSSPRVDPATGHPGDSAIGLGVPGRTDTTATPTPTRTPTRPASVAASGAATTRTPASAPVVAPGEAASTPTATPTSTPTPTPTPTPTTAQQSGDGRKQAPDGNRVPDPGEGRRGLLYAAYGAYIYMARLFVSRLNSSSLTPKFLLRMSLSAAGAMVLGYVAGELGTFRQMVSENQSLFFYFALGLFPGWAAQAMRRKARDLFQPAEEGCDHLALCLVDGLDDETADRLAEIGIWDIQHLACSNPVDVILRSLYPANRVLDWIDQAILIAYVRNKITTFRELGVRSAVELALLYEDLTIDPATTAEEAARKARAEKTVDVLSQKTSMPRESILLIGRYFFEDHTVDVIWRLWQQTDYDS